MFTDFVTNGVGSGEVGEVLQGVRFDAGVMRPWIAKNGQKYVTVNVGHTWKDGKQVKQFKNVKVADLIANGRGNAVYNATLGLTKDQWIHLDNIVLRAARTRLRAWADLSAASSYGGFNAYGKMILETERVSDPGEAVVSMDGMAEGRNDEFTADLIGLPLPITHVDFYISDRKLQISQGSGMPIDSAMAEACGRRIAEKVENTLIGTTTGVTYGDSASYSNSPTVYGYMNYPDRFTKTDMTAPTSTNGTTVVDEILSLREGLYAQGFYGPFMCYVGTNYDKHLDNDFKTNSDKTTRQRLKEIDGIRDVRRLDQLSGANADTVILVQMTGDVARAINGMDITTMQWESNGGMRQNFKVMAIMVPQIRSDKSGNCGIAVGTTS